MSRYEAIEESTMRSLQRLAENATDNEMINNFADNSLLAMSSISKCIEDLKAADVPGPILDSYLMFASAWKHMAAVTMDVLLEVE